FTLLCYDAGRRWVMRQQHATTRMTIDFPKEEHKRLKAMAAMRGISLRQLILDFVHASMEGIKVPNAKTRAAMKDANERKNLTKYSNIDEMLEDLGLPDA